MYRYTKVYGNDKYYSRTWFFRWDICHFLSHAIKTWRNCIHQPIFSDNKTEVTYYFSVTNKMTKKIKTQNISLENSLTLKTCQYYWHLRLVSNLVHKNKLASFFGVKSYCKTNLCITALNFGFYTNITCKNKTENTYFENMFYNRDSRRFSDRSHHQHFVWWACMYLRTSYAKSRNKITKTHWISKCKMAEYYKNSFRFLEL